MRLIFSWGHNKNGCLGIGNEHKDAIMYFPKQVFLGYSLSMFY